MTPLAQQKALDRVRKLRNKPERDTSLASFIEDEQSSIAKARKSLSGVEAAWVELIPGDLADRVEILSFSGGVLTIQAYDASARYDLDRFLRTSGGERALMRRCGTSLKRIKLVVT